MIKRLVLFIVGCTSLAFSDTRFYSEDQITDNILIEMYRVLNQIKDQNEKSLNIMKEINESVKYYSYDLVGQAQEAASP